MLGNMLECLNNVNAVKTVRHFRDNPFISDEWWSSGYRKRATKCKCAWTCWIPTADCTIAIFGKSFLNLVKGLNPGISAHLSFCQWAWFTGWGCWWMNKDDFQNPTVGVSSITPKCTYSTCLWTCTATNRSLEPFSNPWCKRF